MINYVDNQAEAEAAVEEILAANGTALTVRGDAGQWRDRLEGDAT